MERQVAENFCKVADMNGRCPTGTALTYYQKLKVCPYPILIFLLSAEV